MAIHDKNSTHTVGASKISPSGKSRNEFIRINCTNVQQDLQTPLTNEFTKVSTKISFSTERHFSTCPLSSFWNVSVNFLFIYKYRETSKLNSETGRDVNSLNANMTLFHCLFIADMTLAVIKLDENIMKTPANIKLYIYLFLYIIMLLITVNAE